MAKRRKRLHWGSVLFKHVVVQYATVLALDSVQVEQCYDDKINLVYFILITLVVLIEAGLLRALHVHVFKVNICRIFFHAIHTTQCSVVLSML